MRRIVAALAPAAMLTAYALLGTPAAAVPARVPVWVPVWVPAWVTADECTDDGGTITPVGEGKAICTGGTWDNQLIRS
ncbi:hypothetical protein GCM10022224_029720 [Nonomuraea antimicrobica]|uniref:Secreted protein n=1 Tax=Nonomuraea antimicrobica TaxID=561173 RepID=A0ABP7BLI4_9ACTN